MSLCSHDGTEKHWLQKTETNNDLFDAAFENKMCVVSDAVRVTAKAELL